MHLFPLLVLSSFVTLASARTADDQLPPLPPPTTSTPFQCPTLPPLPPLNRGRCKCARSQLVCEGDSSDVAMALEDPCGREATAWTIHGTNISDLKFLLQPCNLGMLDVSHNQISSLEGPLSNCNSLWLLDISHNPLGSIPERIFERMRTLGYLVLDHAQIRHVDEETFLGQYGLVSLKLSFNRLTHVPQNTFKDLWNINVIDLSNNRLLLLPDLLFRRTLSLKFLLLNGNRLTHIQSGIFAGLHQLQYLNVSNNQIPFLQSDIFEGLSGLTRLDARKNVLQEIPLLRNCCSHLDFVDFQQNRIMSPRVETVKKLLRFAETHELEVDARGNPVTRAALCRLLRAGGAGAACDRRTGGGGGGGGDGNGGGDGGGGGDRMTVGCLRGRLGRCRAFGGCYWMRLHEDGCHHDYEEDWHWDFDFDDRK